MILDEKMCKVIARLEYYIGSECCNPNSYMNFHNGWQVIKDIDECTFRYPISVPHPKARDDGYTKAKGVLGTSLCYCPNIWEAEILDGFDITPTVIQYMKYKFGSNELFVGRGIINILKYLEWRYGIDFNELESKRPPDKTE